jgi:hypothetical protein
MVEAEVPPSAESTFWVGDHNQSIARKVEVCRNGLAGLVHEDDHVR